MARHSSRYKALHTGNGGTSSVCDQVRMPRMRVLVGCLCGAFALAMFLGIYLSSQPSNHKFVAADLTKDKLNHKPSKLSLAQVRKIAGQVDIARLWTRYLKPFLVERLPGTPGSHAVRQHIKSQLASLVTGWTVEEDAFKAPTPKGLVTFTNVLAVLDPSAPRRLLLACHYDSKFFAPDPKQPKKVFLGASDSAVPCSMILELVAVLDNQLNALKQQFFYELCGADAVANYVYS